MEKPEYEEDKILLSRYCADAEQLHTVKAERIIKDDDFSEIVVEANEDDGTETDIFVRTDRERFVKYLDDVLDGENIDIAISDDGQNLKLTGKEGDGSGGDKNHSCSLHKMLTYYEDEHFEGTSSLDELNFIMPPEYEFNVDLNLILEVYDEDFGFDTTVSDGLIEVKYPHYQESHKEPSKLTISARYKAFSTDEHTFCSFNLVKFNDDVFTVKAGSGIILYIKCDEDLMQGIDVLGDLSNTPFSTEGQAIASTNYIEALGDLSNTFFSTKSQGTATQGKFLYAIGDLSKTPFSNTGGNL